MDDKTNLTAMHNIVLENRKRMTVSGVREVDNFDEQTIVAVTSMGELTIGGSSLHIDRFSTEDGELAVEGEISSINYSDEPAPSGGFFSRIFR